MPLYEYTCTACGARFERLVTGGRRPACDCGSTRLEKRHSVFAAVSGGSRTTAVSGGSRTTAVSGPPAGCGSCGDPRGPGSCQ